MISMMNRSTEGTGAGLENHELTQDKSQAYDYTIRKSKGGCW